MAYGLSSYWSSACLSADLPTYRSADLPICLPAELIERLENPVNLFRRVVVH